MDVLVLSIAHVTTHFLLLEYNAKTFWISYITLLIAFITMSQLSHFYYRDMRTMPSHQLLIHVLSITAALSIPTFLVVGNLVAGIVFTTIAITLIWCSRAAIQWQIPKVQPQENRIRTIVIGAGEAGRLVVQRLKNHSSYQIIGFVDDDYQKIGYEIHQIPVLSEIKLLPSTVAKLQVEQILIAIPSLSKERLAKIMQLCVTTGLKTRIVPSLEEMLIHNVAINKVRDINIDDLLGRDEVTLDEEALRSTVTKRTVLVTGAGGSIGSEICRQLANLQPDQLILLGHGENSIYAIYEELKSSTSIPLVKVIADIRDESAINDVMAQYQPHIVYHAAAHKHVPLMEDNARESVKNNVFGTKIVATAAKRHAVERFVLISSDKAVDPPNIMGATKRIAEMVIQQLALTGTTKFAIVRFGNVLGSRGSVIPLFQQQIRRGGPITITDERMTRYFMTIPEASRLVLQASALTEGGEVFVLDMGEPVKIIELAKSLIHLSGLSASAIEIKVTGMRAGEKLHESLQGTHEKILRKAFNKIYVMRTPCCEPAYLTTFFHEVWHVPETQLKAYILDFANAEPAMAKRSEGGVT